MAAGSPGIIITAGSFPIGGLAAVIVCWVAMDTVVAGKWRWGFVWLTSGMCGGAIYSGGWRGTCK